MVIDEPQNYLAIARKIELILWRFIVILYGKVLMFQPNYDTSTTF